MNCRQKDTRSLPARGCVPGGLETCQGVANGGHPRPSRHAGPLLAFYYQAMPERNAYLVEVAHWSQMFVTGECDEDCIDNNVIIVAHACREAGYSPSSQDLPFACAHL